MESCEDELEDQLNACAFLPPKVIEEEFNIFSPLKVEMDKKTGRPKFSPIGTAIDEELLAKIGMKKEIGLFKEILARAKVNSIYDINTMKRTTESNINTSHSLNMIKMEMSSIGEKKKVATFLRHCIPNFCEYYSCGLPFKPVVEKNKNHKPWNRRERIDFGLAFVTAYIKGSVKVVDQSEGDNKSGDTEVTDLSTTTRCDQRGIVGVRVYFAHLVQNGNHNPIEIKDLFPVRKSNDKRLKKALQIIGGKGLSRVWSQVTEALAPKVIAMNKNNDKEETFSVEEKARRKKLPADVDMIEDSGDNDLRLPLASLSTVEPNEEIEDTPTPDGIDRYTN